MLNHKFFGLTDTVYHVANANNWESISKHGLLSTNLLFDKFNVSQDDRSVIRLHRRRHDYALTNGIDSVLIRDQKPLPPGGLTKALQKSGMSNDDYLTLLDDRVFFWAKKARLRKLINHYKADPQVVLEVDTNALIQAYPNNIQVTYFNTGYARRRPVDRGPDTFIPIEQYKYDSAREIVEVTVRETAVKILDRVEMPNGTRTRILRRAFYLDASQTPIALDG